MADYGIWLKQLLESPHVTKATLSACTQEQGAYVLWLDTMPLVCLKVGIAGPRQGKGLRGRIGLHFSSRGNNNVLARHLEADARSTWSKTHDFRNREDRQAFLSRHCYFCVLPLSGLTRAQLLAFEKYLVQELQPIYLGAVGQLR